MSRALAASKFTLIVPTYNRPEELGRLLRYLDRHRVQFRVLVIDSSAPAVQRANRAAAAALHCNVSVESFDPATPPWDKFRKGSELVDTPYCSLCADDDLVLPDSIEQIVSFMDAQTDYSVAHGWYFSFHDGPRIGITGSAYSGASLDDDDPLQRLYALFRNYEAVTYGVYRADVMRSVLAGVQEVGSMLGKELLGGALTLVRGKAARLPVFYYGRSHAPSHPYIHWHPLDMLASDPDALYADYSAYRRVVLRYLKEAAYANYGEGELTTLIDLIHFRYLADYVKPKTVEYLLQQVMLKANKDAIMRGLWQVLAQESAPVGTSRSAGVSLLRVLRDRYFPKLKLRRPQASPLSPAMQVMTSTTASGQLREYMLYPGFLLSMSNNKALESEIPRVVAALDRYG